MNMKPFHVRQQEEEEARKREEKAREYAEWEHGYGHKNGQLTHDTLEQKQRRAPDPTPWLNGTAEERVREAKEREETAREYAEWEHGYGHKNGHYVHLQDSASASAHDHRPTQRTRKVMKPLRREPLSSLEPLSSSTYMVCTQAALNTKQARECVYSIE